MPPTVALVIPFHCSDETFPVALESVMAQTVPASEIIVVDDCSPAERATTLRDLPNGVKLVRLPVNSGPGTARQIGSEHSSADWVAYLDADDWWASDKLERQLQVIADNPNICALHGGTTIMTHGVPQATYISKPSPLTPKVILSGGHTVPSTLIVRRDVLMSIGGWTRDRYVLEDWDLAIRLVLGGFEVAFHPEALTMIRRDKLGNLSADAWRDLTIHLACIDLHKAAMVRELGSGHPDVMRRKYLLRFGHMLGGVPGRLVRVAVWMLARRVGH